MRKSGHQDDSLQPRARGESAMNPLVALLAHHDDRAAAAFRDVFEDVACDWRLVRVAEGTAAARHVMNKGLPDLLVLCTDLPEVSGRDFVQWMRSFRSSSPIPVLIFGEPVDENSGEQSPRNERTLMIPPNCSRQELAVQLARLVAQIEKRRFALPS